MNIYSIVKNKILEIVKKNYQHIDDKSLLSITCEQPKNLNFGDLSSNVLLVLKNKSSNKNDKIKEKIISELKATNMFDDVKFIKP